MDRSSSVHILPREHQADLVFHSVEYSIYSAVQKEDELVIEAEQLSDGKRWTGLFTKKYVEEMTANTGNFKKFSVFVNMLWSAFEGRSDSVYVDLLTSSDLDNLRNRTSQTKEPLSRQIPKGKNKRYLILTYTVAFDRVHYPLLLKHVDVPESTALQRTIKRLQSEIKLLRESAQQPNEEQSNAVRDLQKENQNLTRQLMEEKEAHKLELLEIQRVNDDLKQQLSKERIKVQSLTSQIDKLMSQRLQYNRERVLRTSNSPLSQKRNNSSSRQVKRPGPRTSSRQSVRSQSSAGRSQSPALSRIRAHPLLGRSSPSPVRRKGRSRSPRIPRFDPTAYIKQRRNQNMNRSPSPWGNPPPLKPRSRSKNQRSTETVASEGSMSRAKIGKYNRSFSKTRSQSRDAAQKENKATLVNNEPKRFPSKARPLSVRSSSSSDSSSSQTRLTSPLNTPLDRIFPRGHIRAVDERLSELHTFLKVAKTANRKLAGE